MTWSAAVCQASWSGSSSPRASARALASLWTLPATNSLVNVSVDGHEGGAAAPEVWLESALELQDDRLGPDQALVERVVILGLQGALGYGDVAYQGVVEHREQALGGRTGDGGGQVSVAGTGGGHCRCFSYWGGQPLLDEELLYSLDNCVR